ncbi:hypothetical protein F2P81_001569 [Scophthalmus maximus]|uniref:E3 ubiquitin-protein ligase E3D n=1 Tax=Scophthalmus maximus TaxID=52904 RepID=A0A6A4TN67_SCOMX|nr:hypothetical protein F2P81_001569 [Scophthalmus maximus]
MAACETRSRTHEVGVFVELRRRLQTGLLIVGKDLAGSPADVTVTGGDSSLCVRTRRGELSLTLPAGVALEQGSCVPTPAGESCEEELHYRLRIGVERSSEEEASDSVMETLRAKETYCFHCQGCMTRLLEDRVFKRVLPLPNGNWNALVDDWCCHPDPFAKKLLPRAEDCLLGDTFLLLARDDGCDQTLTEEVSPVGAEDGQDPKKPCRRLTLISCKSCSTALGEAVAPGTLKLYFTQVVVEPAVGDRKWGASLDRQLWLLNSDSIIASVPETRVGGLKSIGPATLHSPSPGAARALKLLYVACSDTGAQQRDIVTSWEVSVIGHPVVLPLKVCEELQKVIDDSNSTLPASMRRMRSYQHNCNTLS